MKQNIFTFILLLFFFSPTYTPALADEKIDCDNAITQTDMNICSYQEFQAADINLNKAYQDAIAYLEEIDGSLKEHYPERDLDAVETLRNAQRYWIKFRDLECKAEGASYTGGSIQPLIHNSCMARLTIERTKDLAASYKFL